MQESGQKHLEGGEGTHVTCEFKVPSAMFVFPVTPELFALQ